MTVTLNDLATRFRTLADEMPDRVSKVAADVALEIVTELVSSPPSGTPVDTSQAESNWQVKVNEPVETPIAPYFAGKQGSTQAQSGQAVIEAAAAVLTTKKPGETIYISNVVPYIRRLAYEGHSKQSPPGWVENAVLIGRVLLSKARARLLS